MPASTSHPPNPTTTPVKEVERAPEKNLGNGGRPPHVPWKTGGGGDGDGENWQEQPAGSRGPRERLGRARQGLFSALAGDAFFFLVPAVLWMMGQGAKHIDVHNNYVNNWHPMRLPHVLWLTTGILILSSVSMEMARRHMFRETDVMEEWLGLGRPAVKRTLPWLLVTLLLGITFLAGQWTAWMQVTHSRSFKDSALSHNLFGVIALLHGLHVIAGLLALLVAVAAIFRLARVESRQILVDCTAWYWHAMGFFWLCLFGMLLATQ